jgi:hypothetical protein
MTKQSICLTTYFDENYAEMGSICLKSMERYAKKFNIKIELMNNFKSDRPPAWNKIKIVRKLLNKYDFVLWIDSDALFVRFDEDIRREIESGKDFYLVKHHLKSREAPNTGLFLIRNTAWSRSFLDKVWNSEKYIYHNFWENAAVIDLLGYNDALIYNKYKLAATKLLYKLGIKRLVTKILAKLKVNKIIFNIFDRPTKHSLEKKDYGEILKKVKWLNLKWNSLPKVCESRNSIINHYPAMPYKERLERMIVDSKNT